MKKISRRNFVKTTAVSAASLSLFGLAGCKKTEQKTYHRALVKKINLLPLFVYEGTASHTPRSACSLFMCFLQGYKSKEQADYACRNIG